MALVYSCCFWFSLRLSGILIGAFSIIQAVAFLIGCCIAYAHPQLAQDQFAEWSEQYNMIHSKELVDRAMEDPEKSISLTIVGVCVYLLACVIYIYGAYICNNFLMFPFIVLELVRLLLMSAMVATLLMLLKETTLDIGSLIGASVLGGFFLLGMFYLWVCAANLPIVINEWNSVEQATTIAKLEHILDTNPRPRRGFDNVRYTLPEDPPLVRDVFIVSNKKRVFERSMQGSRIPIPY